MKKYLFILSTILALLFAQCRALASSYPIPGSTEDAAHSSGDRGTMPLGVRKDANDTALTNTDGDYSPLTTNDVGNLKVQVEPSRKATYMATSTGSTLAASCTDFATMTGSASKTIKILKIFLQPTCTGTWGPTHVNTYKLIKRSTADSGGTSSTLTAVPLDSNSAAASGTARVYSANPTLGTAVGTIYDAHIPNANDNYGYGSDSQANLGYPIFDVDKFGSALILRGTSEQACLNLNGVTQGGTSPLMRVTFVWTEEHPAIATLLMIALVLYLQRRRHQRDNVVQLFKKRQVAA